MIRHVPYIVSQRHVKKNVVVTVTRLSHLPPNISRNGLSHNPPVSRLDIYCLRSKMSVLLETSLGDITIDLLVDYAPRNCEK